MITRGGREWRSGRGRKAVLIVGWMALIVAVAGLAAFAVSSGTGSLVAAGIGGFVATVCSGAVPEPKQRHRRARFAPLEGLRRARRKPSLVRQLLTLP